MWFDFGRKEGFPTIYPPNQTPVTVDVLEAGFLTAFIILLIAFYISFPTSRIIQTASRYFRISVLLSIGLLLLLENFGQEWEVGDVKTQTPYKSGSSAQIPASIALKIGLRSINITLKSTQIPPELKAETIDYNERFEWTWDQGRIGFGPYSGTFQQEFRAAQYRGLPTPILWVAEYFIIDGEGFRFGRFYRTAGWYCHISLWCAFACWLLALILFQSVIIYAGYFLGFCGLLQLLANILWVVVRNPNPLVIRFEDGTITTKFGFTFWATFVNGIVCLVIAVGIIVMDSKFHMFLYGFFDVDPLNSYDGVAYLTKEEQMVLRNKKSDSQGILLRKVKKEEKDEEDEEYVPVYIKRQTTVGPQVLRMNKPKYDL